MADGTPLPNLAAAINSDINPAAKGMYGATGGFQPIQGEMFGSIRLEA